MIVRSKEKIAAFDRLAPHYFVWLTSSDKAVVQVMLQKKPVQNVEKSEITFDPKKPWVLYLLIESSQWVSPIQQNSAILSLLENIETPPESIETYSFHAGIEKLETDKNVPVFLKESNQSDVYLLDSIQRITQIIQKNKQNSILCVVGSGRNTVNLTDFPLPSCPVWCFFQNKIESKSTPYLETISMLSGGTSLTFQELDLLDKVALPNKEEKVILHFSVPYQWFNFQKQIRIRINNQDSSDFLTLFYPTPWVSLIMIVFLFLVMVVLLFRILRINKNNQPKKYQKRYNLAWLEWTGNSSEKQNKRIHLCNFTIGSSQNCHLSLQDDSISDYHTLIQEKEMVFTITDLSSRSGVWINHSRVFNSILHDGDQIQLGNLILTFRQSHIKYESNEKYL
ncbi:MAG: FHA domain-containing protein [Caldisericia bacterium]|nr:FHA domain-containing protein [Caldisericia bacterium]